MTLKLTPARRKALAVLADADASGVNVRVSNATTPPGAPAPAVYWQVVDWLVKQGLAVDEGRRVVLTPEGRRAAEEQRCHTIEVSA